MDKFYRIDEKKVNKIKKMLDKWVSHREIADVLGCSLTTVSKVRKTIWNDINREISSKDYLEDINKNKQKQELNILKKKNESLMNDIQEKEVMYDTWKQVSKDNDKIVIKKNTKKNENESTAVYVYSDWHVEETIDPATVNWLNEYNLQIAEERAIKLFQNSLSLYQSLEKPNNVRNVIFALLWDFITWYIHPELLEWNSLSPTEAILMVKKLITAWIDLFLNETTSDITVVTAFGNHGRTTDKKRVSTWRKNSYEWLMYNIIAERYLENERVKFKVEKGNHNYIQVYDKVLRMHHWDMVKYQWWVGGITIPINKAIAQRNKAKRADYDIFWHWHQARDWGNFISNWSLIWYWPYAESIKADYEDPKQMMFLIDEKFGKTITSPIIVL